MLLTKKKACAVYGCKRIAESRGYCHYHYRKDRELKLKPPETICQLPSCKEIASHSGWCEKHYQLLTSLTVFIIKK